MNCYLISSRGQQYATDADNMLEAETKFTESYGIDSEEFRITQVEVTPALRDDDTVIWF